ncbi:hypothetical protein DYB30_008840 [Aphanomyces astaci]|uniref:Uncharacterized protein n=1 Tax=Aphanomyces astaci TaxID=112090 RepID=A0A397CBZ8_APHAT|nr:hypothetical protein DYB30_008840 [Aphanomyces astaci]
MSEAKPKKRLDAVVRSRVQPVLELLHKANTSSQDLSVESRQLLAELSRTKRVQGKLNMDCELRGIDLGATCVTTGQRHERFIQAKELTYLLNVSDDYYVLNVAQYASYSRDMRLFPVHVCVLKVVLLGVFTFGRSRYPSIDMQPLQGMLFAVVLIVVVTHRSWWASPFRCRSTAQLSFVLDSLLTFDAIMGTDPQCMFAGVVVGTFCKKRARQLNWPTHIHMRPLVRHVAQVTKWVAALKAADHVLQRVCYFFVLSSFRLSLGNDQLHEMAALISAAYVEALGSAVLASERIDDCVNKFTSELQHYKVATRYSPNTKRFE